MGTAKGAGEGAPSPARSSLPPYAVALLVALLSLLPYLQAGGHGYFRIDDPAYLRDNPWVARGLSWEGVRTAFGTFQVGNWHPLAWLSHMADVSLFGMDPGAFHLVNAALHALNGALCFLALFRLSGLLRPAALAAALFAVHPLHVESVAWLAERKDLLSGTFFFLVLLAWERYARLGGAGRYLLALALFALGLMAKPMLVTLPFLLLLLDLWPLGRGGAGSGEGKSGAAAWGRLAAEKAPFLVLSILSSVVTYLAQESGGAVFDDVYSLPWRLGNAVLSYGAYLSGTFWPSGLAAFYPQPRSLSPAAIAASAAILLALSAAAVSRVRKSPWLFVGWCWFLGTLVPVIGLVQVGVQAHADRYAYLPVAGIFTALAFEAEALLGRFPSRLRAAQGAAAAVLVLLALVTWRQVRYWKDSATLFARTLEVTGDNWMIRHSLGQSLVEAGRYEEAVVQLREALRIVPGYGIVLHDLAVAHGELAMAQASRGMAAAAEANFRAAVEAYPSFAEGRMNLAVLLERMGRREEALAEYREAVRLRPGLAAVVPPPGGSGGGASPRP